MTENPDTLAQALAKNDPEPLEPDAAAKPARDPWRWLRLRNQALILEPDGRGEVHDIKGPHIRTRSGAYTPLVGKRFRLTEAVGPGYVTLFFSGNPEPITTVPPAGFGAAF